MHGIDPGILHTKGRVYRISSVLYSEELAGSVPRLCLPISSTYLGIVTVQGSCQEHNACTYLSVRNCYMYTVKEILS